MDDTRLTFGVRRQAVIGIGTCRRGRLSGRRRPTLPWNRSHSRQTDQTVATIGRNDAGVFVQRFDCSSGHMYPRLKPGMPKGSVHLTFSADGQQAIADYGYASVLIWDLEQNKPLTSPFSFSAAAGLSFDLGYDLIRDLRDIRRISGGEVASRLSGNTPVRVNSARRRR